MKRLGITGGIGSGKSTVSRLLRQSGIPVYDSDSEAKRLMHTLLRQPIEQLFGSQAYEDENLNRKYIASQVFCNPELLNRLNAIVHPAVGEDFERWAEEQSDEVPFVALESAILFESGFDSRVDVTLLVDAPIEERIRRTVLRDGSSPDEVRARIAHQNTELAQTKADYVIHNHTESALAEQVNSLYINLKQLWK
ncbi:MAG: dephospho-CoA kinase [Rikenellaceae bacterium]|nr:dephospho-CoA kinase [Rikenellaceae bacterium]